MTRSRAVRGYHGTATAAQPGRRTFSATNVSLGGTYITKNRALAEVYAQTAAREHSGEPVVLDVRVPDTELLPDEDWVVNAAESREDPPPRVQAFLDDLFQGYLGEGWSLSDHYKERYDELNRRHGITWRDSWEWVGTARLDRLLSARDFVRTRRR